MIARRARFEAVEVAAAVGGDLDPGGVGPDRRFLGIATDSRDALEGRLFVALVGARHDAHDFLRAAVEGGAAGLLVSKAGFDRAGGRDAVGADVEVVRVDDTLAALGALARHHRRRIGVPVLALTGSNGKTSTKEMMAAALGVERRVLATPGNLNNLVGLPLTLLGLEPEHEVAVTEMGMNALGEIAAMVAIAEPEVGLVTNVGPAHIGELGSIENIARAKGEMYAGLDPERGIGVVNLDDPRVVDQADRAGLARRRTFGAGAGADVRLIGTTGRGTAQWVRLEVDGEELSVEIQLPGLHQAQNLAAAVAAVTALPGVRPSRESLIEGLEGLAPVEGRGTVRRIGAYTVIDETYNANAASAAAAIEAAIALAQGRRVVAAIGEMKELGAFSEEAHREVGAALRRAGVDVVAAFGAEAGPVAEAAGPRSRHEAEDLDALIDWLFDALQPGDVLLVKGSRGSRMERVITRLEERV